VISSCPAATDGWRAEKTQSTVRLLDFLAFHILKMRFY
jgi:hypothetical protein